MTENEIKDIIKRSNDMSILIGFMYSAIMQMREKLSSMADKQEMHESIERIEIRIDRLFYDDK